MLLHFIECFEKYEEARLGFERHGSDLNGMWRITAVEDQRPALTPISLRITSFRVPRAAPLNGSCTRDFKMESLEAYFETFFAAFPEADPNQKKQIQAAFHAGAMAVCEMLARADSEHYSNIIKELQQEEHAFGRKEL